MIRHAAIFVLLFAVLGGEFVSAAENLIFMSTNNPTGNAVLVLGRDTAGTLTQLASHSMNGTGFGGNLESQSPLTLSQDGRFLFAVNAASNTIASFRVAGAVLEFVGVFDSGGQRPTSLAERRGVLYVMNEGLGNNIVGFNVGSDGHLFPISGGTAQLTRESAGGAQVAFHPVQDLLIVTERFSNRIGVYELDAVGGILRGPRIVRSAGRFPFGFAFTSRGQILISEAFGGRNGGSAMSSYNISRRGGIGVVSRSVGTREIAACWVAVTSDDRYAYTTNTGSNSITGYRVNRNARLKLLDRDGISASTGSGTAPTEAAINPDGSTLFVILQATSALATFGIDETGALIAQQVLPLPPHPVGLVVR